MYVSPRQRTLGSVVPERSVVPGGNVLFHGGLCFRHVLRFWRRAPVSCCTRLPQNVLSGPGFAPNLRLWTPWSFEMTPRRHGGALRNPGGSSPRLWAQSAPLVRIDLDTALSPRAQGGMRSTANAPEAPRSIENAPGAQRSRESAPGAQNASPEQRTLWEQRTP